MERPKKRLRTMLVEIIERAKSSVASAIADNADESRGYCGGMGACFEYRCFIVYPVD